MNTQMSLKNTTDPLTGLPDYAAFLRDVRVELKRAHKAGECVSVALLDIDWFGKINENHGRGQGDRIIQQLTDSVALSIGATASRYRYGGDAVVLLFRDTEKEQAFLQTELARKNFERESVAVANGNGGQSIELSFSAGVAAFPDDAQKVQDLLRKCNEALYRAKVSGRNKVCLAREEKMVTKTTHYTQGQLEGLSRLAKRDGLNEATLLREALDDLLRKHNS